MTDRIPFAAMEPGVRKESEQDSEPAEISMARHIAYHFQILMLLTIRLINSDRNGDQTENNKSQASEADRASDTETYSARDDSINEIPDYDDITAHDSSKLTGENPRTYHDYKIAWVCGLPKVHSIATAMLDERVRQSTNFYKFLRGDG
ncbi:hypothetical protein H072_4352 [Dactylellina haptotyla CBS 200.50]|uniref:Uncharacterized protein n=1 Tax=Dactylellina haptotyla (strain CBS 200.50) TaxID=1284197 RepID=S8AKY7_DACHA|nr:hypothetical protein H072_4352 [Dactylellina haptotyla CBS 200.50]